MSAPESAARFNWTLRHQVDTDLGEWARPFFDACLPRLLARPDIVMVSHAVQGLSGQIYALERVGRISGVIVKPNSINPDHFGWLSANYSTSIGDRARMNSESEVIRLIDSLVDPSNNFLVADIGGYFAPHIDALGKHYGARLLGAIEDTENGLRRYESQQLTEVRVLSVARSEIKLPEDQMVGRWITRSWEMTRKELGYEQREEHPVVIGFGKVGASIAASLKGLGYTPQVVETNPLRALVAHGLGFGVSTIEDVLPQASVIFSATGNRSLGSRERAELREGVVIFAATSRDDEFDFPGLTYEWELVRTESRRLTVYERPDGAQIFMVNDGYSANFAFPDFVEAEYLAPTHAAIAVAAKQLVKFPRRAGIDSLDKVAQSRIAEKWLSEIAADGDRGGSSNALQR